MSNKYIPNAKNNINKITINTISEKYQAVMILHAMGDTIGFKNGDWEFMAKKTEMAERKNQRKQLRSQIKKLSRSQADKIEEQMSNKKPNFYEIFKYSPLQKIYEFIELGGINFVPQKGWRISDDTILHMGIARGLLSKFSDSNELCDNLQKEFIKDFDELVKDNGNYRIPGNTTVTNLNKLRKGENWKDIPYNFYSGGSGASMRSSCIGLAFHGNSNREKLIEYSINASRITHNSAIGYLGGMVSALFVAYAMEDIPVDKWVFNMLDLFIDGTVEKVIRKIGRDVDNYMQDSPVFVNKWITYTSDKFNDQKIISRPIDTNLVQRNMYYHNRFEFMKSNYFPGGGGDDSVIIAYDCLLDAKDSWEKLVIYSMLHGGDTDTTGCIAASWWGAIKGFEGVPMNLIENIEYIDELEKLGNDLFNKYT